MDQTHHAVSTPAAADQGAARSIAPPHPREEERIRALRTLNVLDTAGSSRFDRITAFAADLFDVPTAVISLVDVNRQWFLSRCGIEASETDRDVAFCAHAILETSGLLVVEDTELDPRFAANPLVADDPHIRFYAGAVIYDGDHLPLGTLCIIGGKPRAFSEAEQRHLVQLAQIAQLELLPTGNTTMERTKAQIAAEIDPLTNARWRNAFSNLVNAHLQDPKGLNAKLIVVDLENLPKLNEIFGRRVGDEIVMQTAKRLKETLLPIGRVELGRIDGRRLAAFLTECTSRSIYDVEGLVVAAVSSPIHTGAGELFPEIQVGLSNCDNKEKSHIAAELERCRVALRAHPTNERVVSAVFAEDQEGVLLRKLKIGIELPAAIASSAFNLFYQPKIHATDQTLSGFEALLRWHHRELGNVSPPETVVAAEELRFSEKLDLWVIGSALAQMEEWRRAGLDYGSVSVNVTGLTLLNPEFPKWLDAELVKHGVGPGHLDLEIVESSIFDNFDAVVAAMSRVRDLGVSFSLDDFGTGNSSLAYLRSLPVDTIKIDRAFVKHIVNNQRDAALCAGVVAICRDLGLTVVAEGVETEQQHLILRSYRCDLMQGFYYSKPISASDTTELLQSDTKSFAV